MSFNIEGPSAMGDNLVWEDLKGRLLLVRPLREQEAKSEFGESTVVVADITLLDGDEAGKKFAEAFIFPKVLQNQVKPAIHSGALKLGRVGQGVKNPGKSAPWILLDPTSEDMSIAKTYMASLPGAAPAPEDTPPF